MKKSICKRISAVLAMLAITMSVVSCNDSTKNRVGTGEVAEGQLFPSGTAITIALSSHATWPYDEEWVIWDYMREKTGAELQIQAIPLEDFFTKVSLMMTSADTLPDLLHITQKKMVNQCANMGALLAFDDNLQKLPNYQEYIASLDPTYAENLLMTRRCSDGKIYNAPATGMDSASNNRAWMYRKDIFDKHGLSAPTTYDEVYEVSKKLKEIYPESYPFCFRHGFTQIRNMGPQWDAYHSFDIYYDYDEKVFKYGAFEDTTRDMIAWYAMMVEEKLAPVNCVDISTKEWEELIASDRGFITADYIVRIDHFNKIFDGTDSKFELAFMAPPKKSANEGFAKMPRVSLDLSGYAVCNTGNQATVDNAFKFIDWMYTDDAMEILSWGKEGETYETLENGRRRFIIDEEKGETANGNFGITSFGTYQRIDPAAVDASYSDYQVAAFDESGKYLEDFINPMWWLAFSDEEEKEISDLDTSLASYAQEWLGKFINGQEPMSKWDEYIDGARDYDVERYIELYTNAYERAMGK